MSLAWSKGRHSAVMLLSSAALLAINPSVAAAQAVPAAEGTGENQQEEAGTQGENDGGEIVVTAARRAQAASSIPFNISAISEETLREQNITDLNRLIEISPSINAPGTGARFNDSVTVRGLNVSPVSANNLEQFARTTIAYYLDDTPLPDIGYRIKDIARVETLLGPQGTLYGAGSLGGTIRFITNRPAFGETSARLSTSIYAAKGGSLSHDTDGVVNLPLGTNVAIRGSLARLDDSGYTDRVSNPFWRRGALAWTTIPDPNRNVYEDDDYTRTTTGRVVAAWRIADGVRVSLSHARQNQLAHGTSATSLLPLAIANARDPSDFDAYVRDPDFSPCTTDCRFTDAGSTPTLAGRDVVASRYPEFARRRFNLTSGELEVDLGFADLQSSTSYFRDRRRGEADYAGPGWTFYFSLGDAGAAFDSDRSAFLTFDNAYSGWNHETRLVSSHDGPFSWVVGLFHTNTRRNWRFSEFLPGLDEFNGINRAGSGGNADEGYRENLGDRYRETAGFGELTYAITPRWSVTAGARLFTYNSRAIAQIRDYSFDLVNNNVDVETEGDLQGIYKLNSWYDLTSNALVYATVSQGFRRGGTNGFRDIGGLTVSDDLRTFDPDRTTNYEAGLKGYFADRRLYLQLNAFQIDWKDVQTYFSQFVNGFPVNGTANGPDARSRGVEGSVRARITDRLTASFSTAYTKAEWSETRTVCLYTNETGCRTWSEGGDLGGTPEWKHFGDLRYEQPLGRDLNGFLNLTGRYVGSIQVDRADEPDADLRRYPSYSLFDIRTGLTWRDLTASLFVENVANKRAKVSEQFDRVMGTRVFFTRPRTVGLNFSYGF